MSVHAAGFEHRVYILSAVFTHVVVGFVLSSLYTRSNSIAGVVGAILPDIDLLFSPAWQFPLVHRGLTHTPLLGVTVVGVSLAIGKRYSVALGVGIGYLSHLLIDSFTQSGVMWLYPFVTAHQMFDAHIHAPRQTALIWLLTLAIWLRYRNRESDRDAAVRR